MPPLWSGALGIIGSEVRSSQIKPRECEARRAIEWGVTTFARAVARELLGYERYVRLDDSRLAERLSKVCGRGKGRADRQTRCDEGGGLVGPKGGGLPADIDLPRRADRNRWTLIAAGVSGDLQRGAEGRSMVSGPAKEDPVAAKGAMKVRLSGINVAVRGIDGEVRLVIKRTQTEGVAGKNYGADVFRMQHSLKSPACSCVSITLPASS